MHLLATRPGNYNEESTVVTLGQTPADIVILSAADTDLSLLAHQYAKHFVTGDYPSLRLANLNLLRNAASIDIYIDEIVRHARLIIASVLGGLSYWPYLCEQLAATVHAKDDASLILIPGDDQPDPQLASLCTSDAQTTHRIWRYVREGGDANARALFYFIGVAFFNRDDQYDEPRALPRALLYHPQHSPATMADWRRTWQASGLCAGQYDQNDQDEQHARRHIAPHDAPVVALLFYRVHLQSANTDVIDVLCKALQEAGCKPLPIAVNSLKELRCMDIVNALLEEACVAVILNTTAFNVSQLQDEASAFGDDVNDDASKKSNDKNNDTSTSRIASKNDTKIFARDVPVIQLIFSSTTREHWEKDTQGMSARDLAMSVALPEVDGRIIARTVSFKALLERNDATQSDRIVYRPHVERMRWCAQLAFNWCMLQRRANRDKHVALLLANYPTREGRIGNGVGLDTPQSTVHILQTLADAGYAVQNIPRDSDALMQQLLKGATNDLEISSARAAMRGLHIAKYCEWFATLPAASQEQVLNRWGTPQNDAALRGDYFPLAGILFGNIFVGIQPARGYHIDVQATYHDPDLVPPHNYLAFYCYLRTHYDADAIVHVGKHGNLEWLPGKSVALSDSCWPDIALGPMPNVYPFIVNDPGEGSQAKRRAQAVIIDHLTPPLTRAETYGPLAQLEQMVDEYYDALNMDARRARVLREDILQALRRHNLQGELEAFRNARRVDDEDDHDRDTRRDENVTVNSDNVINAKAKAGANANDEAGEQILQRLDAYLCELKEAQIRDGLHIFGTSPTHDQRDDTLLALMRLPRGDGRGANAGLLDALARDFQLDAEFKPLDHDPASPWHGARPSALIKTSDAPWRTAGDTRERLELYARALIKNMQSEAGNVARKNNRDGNHDDNNHDKIPGPNTRTVLKQMQTRIAPALDSSGARELAGLSDALAGRFVAPGPSGAPSRGRPDVLPTGRNFYSVDTRAIPTPTAWRLGFQSASLLIARYMQDHGDYPRTLGLSVWGTATMRTGGDDIAQAMALLGVQPSWTQGRVTGFDIMPLSVLARPRVDVTLRVSGFFRDAFYNVIKLFDAAVQAVAELDEAPQDNPLRAHVIADTESRIAGGMSHEKARREAGWRVFGAKPGGYGAGLQNLIDERCWQQRGDLAHAYLAWGGYAYDSKQHGAPAMDSFRQRLAGLQAVLHNQDNREHDILDADDYYQFHGGMTVAAETFGGAQPAIYHGDHANPATPRIRSLQEEINRVMRSRVVNPKWIAGMQRHGYKGAFEMTATVDYLFAYDATTGVVHDYQYEMVADAYLLDEKNRAFIKQHNPNALREISERLLEAMQRGLWSKPGTYRTRIEEILLEAEEGVEV